MLLRSNSLISLEMLPGPRPMCPHSVARPPSIRVSVGRRDTRRYTGLSLPSRHAIYQGAHIVQCTKIAKRLFV